MGCRSHDLALYSGGGVPIDGTGFHTETATWANNGSQFDIIDEWSRYGHAGW